jgi:hypothetical protein
MPYSHEPRRMTATMGHRLMLVAQDPGLDPDLSQAPFAGTLDINRSRDEASNNGIRSYR